jgi:hypothetical protein
VAQQVAQHIGDQSVDLVFIFRDEKGFFGESGKEIAEWSLNAFSPLHVFHFPAPLVVPKNSSLILGILISRSFSLLLCVLLRSYPPTLGIGEPLGLGGVGFLLLVALFDGALFADARLRFRIGTRPVAGRYEHQNQAEKNRAHGRFHEIPYFRLALDSNGHAMK